jgi:hypothetical protein
VVFNLLDKKLDRKIRDLEDTRISMDCLRDIRIQEVEFEMAIELVEVHEILLADSYDFVKTFLNY